MDKSGMSEAAKLQARFMCWAMSDLSDLYQEVILGPQPRPPQFRVSSARWRVAQRRARPHHPLCGYKLTL